MFARARIRQTPNEVSFANHYVSSKERGEAMKIDRLLGILMQLISKKKVTAKELADHFEVSVRTIQRDMDTLNRAGVPLYADVGKHGGYALLDNYKLDKSFLSRSEANILIKFLENINSIGPSKEISSLYNKFQITNHDFEDEEKLIIELNPLISSGFIKENLSRLSSARDSQSKVGIKYYAVNLKETYRVINPYILLMSGTKWYVYGYCELRKDFRMFKLSRITSVEILEEKFDKIELPEVKPWETSGDNPENQEKIILKLDTCLLGKIADIFPYHCCDIREDHILITVYSVLDEWFYSMLLSLTPYVEVLEPARLKKSYIEKLKSGIEKNYLTTT